MGPAPHRRSDNAGRRRAAPSRLDVASLRAHLDALVAAVDPVARRESDPIAFVHRYASDADREVVGLVASSLAFGNVKAIQASVARVLAVLGPSPAARVDAAELRSLEADLGAFVHRVYRGPDVARMLVAAGALRRKHGSLGAAFAAGLDASGGDLREGLARFADALRGEHPSRGLRHLLPDPRAGSACKRLHLYLRWMVRRADGIDLGIFRASPSLLLVPVDTHVHRIARNLGLTRRADASWRTAEEITAALRSLDAHDPVRYDFALCHLGVSRDCPSRRDPIRCATCVLRPVCRAWR